MLKVKSFMANNQAILIDGNKTIFQSYDSIIAIVNDGNVSLSKDYKYSKTTMKYVCRFFGVDSIKEIDERIERGEFLLDIDNKGNPINFNK